MEDIELEIHGDSIIDRNAPDSYFKASFGGGSYIKGLVAQLCLMGSHATFRFNPEGIRLVISMFDEAIVGSLWLDSSTYPYEFTGTDDVLAYISLKDLNNALSSISKSSGVILEKQKGKDMLNIIPTEAASGIPLTSRSTIRFTVEPFDDITKMEYPRSPVCYVKSNKFSQMFSGFSKNKVARVECYMGNSGIKFMGNNDLATNNIEHVYGDFDESFETLDNLLVIRTDMCKSLTKLGALNSDSEVRVFQSPENPHLFVVPVSTYGSLDLYISDCRTEEAIEYEYELAEAQEKTDE